MRPDNRCFQIEVNLLFRVSSRGLRHRFETTFGQRAKKTEAVRIIISNDSFASAKRASKMVAAWKLFAAVTRCVSAFFGCQFGTIDEHRNLFRVICHGEKSKFQCQHAYFKVFGYIPPGNHLKNVFVSLNFTPREGDVLGIRHHLNSSSCVRQSSWRLTSMSTFLTDSHVCVCESGLIAWECEILPARDCYQRRSDFCFRFAKRKPR